MEVEAAAMVPILAEVGAVAEALVTLLSFVEKHALAAILGWRRMAQVADAVVAGVRLLPPSGLNELSQAVAALRSNFNNTVLKIPRYVAEDEEDEDYHLIAERYRTSPQSHGGRCARRTRGERDVDDRGSDQPNLLRGALRRCAQEERASNRQDPARACDQDDHDRGRPRGTPEHSRLEHHDPPRGPSPPASNGKKRDDDDSSDVEVQPPPAKLPKVAARPVAKPQADGSWKAMSSRDWI